MRVETRTKGSLHAPRVRAIKDGTHVMMSGNCPSFSFGPCHAEVVLHVPVGTAVDVRSSSGDITASGVGGPLRARHRLGRRDRDRRDRQRRPAAPRRAT